MAPKIWSATDRIFCHFGPVFALLPSNNQKNQDFAWHEGSNFYFSFSAIFCLFPPNNPKNQNLKKMKKMPGDIIILHVCQKL